MDELTPEELAILRRARDEGGITAALYAGGKRLIRDFRLNILCEELAERGFLVSLGQSGERASADGVKARWRLGRRGEQTLAKLERPRRAA